jgi:regulator of RNase E activity RraB
VEHWLYLPDAARRAQVAARVQQEGFTVVDQHDPEAEDEAYGLRIAREDAVEPEHIHAVTAWLLQVADEQGGEYDGWECPVVT